MNSKIAEARKLMEKSIEHLKTEFSKLRIGRASTTMVENLKVDAYGNNMTLKEVAALATPDARTITIQPWDKGILQDIEKGILSANIGLTPINDGKLIRLTLPPITEERRKEFVKQIKKIGEDTKIAIRNIRRDSLDSLRKEKPQGASEDETRRLQDELQKVTDEFTAEVDKLVEQKSKELIML